LVHSGCWGGAAGVATEAHFALRGDLGETAVLGPLRHAREGVCPPTLAPHGVELGRHPLELLADHVEQPSAPALEPALFAGSSRSRASRSAGPQTRRTWADDFSDGLTQEAVVNAFLLEVHQSEVARARQDAQEAKSAHAGCLEALSEASSTLAAAVDAYSEALDELRTSGPDLLCQLGALADPPPHARVACEAALVVLRLEPRPAPRPVTGAPGGCLGHWGLTSELLLDGTLLQLLLSFDKEHADPEVLHTFRDQYVTSMGRTGPSVVHTLPGVDLLTAWLRSVEAYEAASGRVAAAREAEKATRRRAGAAAETLAAREAALGALLLEVRRSHEEHPRSRL